MTINQYIDPLNQVIEQDLIQDLITETIQIKGVDCIYIVRNSVAHDKLYAEDTQATFTTTFTVEMYVASQEGFEGDGDLFTKFGIEIRDQIKFLLSKQRCTQVIGRPPKEGDLIYFPLKGAVFEIKFVEDDEVNFYQFGALYVYGLKCELFEYSYETFATGVNAIDSLAKERDYQLPIALGAGSGTYTVGEIVYTGQTLNSAVSRAIVHHYDAPGGILTLVKVNGFFRTTEGVIKGNTSLASYTPASVNSIDLPQTKIADNKIVETGGIGFVNFNESDPFSSGKF